MVLSLAEDNKCTVQGSLRSVIEEAEKLEQYDEQVLRRFIRLQVQNVDLNTWVYLGPSGDYVLVPGLFCSCNDFTIRVIGKREKCYCKHLVEQAVSERKKLYKTVNLESFEEYVKILNEVFTQNLTSTLRRRLYSR
jgi:predicted nucleic acid-binding Zn finger protein